MAWDTGVLEVLEATTVDRAVSASEAETVPETSEVLIGPFTASDERLAEACNRIGRFAFRHAVPIRHDANTPGELAVEA